MTLLISYWIGVLFGAGVFVFLLPFFIWLIWNQSVISVFDSLPYIGYWDVVCMWIGVGIISSLFKSTPSKSTPKKGDEDGSN